MGIWARLKELSNYDQQIREKQDTLTNKQNEVDRLVKTQTELSTTIDNLTKDKELAIQTRDIEVAKTEEACKHKIAEFEERTQATKLLYEEASLQLTELQEKKEKLDKQCNILTETIKIYKALIKRINKAEEENKPIPADVLAELENSTGSIVELHLHALEVKDLRSLYKDNEKLIESTLSKYEIRYTTKANRAIYQLMVIAMRAELQNILTNMRFSTLQKNKEDLNKIINRYFMIASDGNQSIAPTLENFIMEIELLFNKALDIEYEYYIRREKEKAEQQALRDQMKQEAEERKALEQQQKQIEKEESKYITEISRVEAQLLNCEDDILKEQLQLQIQRLNEQLEEVEKKKEEIINLQNGKAGYVYIISNLGSFGDNKFKIGMTRRLDPMDRIRELSSASVPFSFDVHSFIFSDNAVDLESAIHQSLHNQRTNKVNSRKEFFTVSINELEALVQELDPTAEFTRTMIATEYYQSVEMSHS